MPERRWRQVQVEDEGWRYEESDPSFVAKKLSDGSEIDVDGWRPLACLWKYCYTEGEVIPPLTFREISSGYKPKIAKRPWRTRMTSEGPKGQCRDYETREIAKDKVERSITPVEKSEAP